MAARPPYLLVADDDLDMRKLLVAALAEAAPGVEVHTAVDGGVALELVREQAPVLLLLDQDMPVLDGLGVLEALRKEEATRGLPVLLISATAGSAERARATALPPVRFLNKPVQPAVVVRVVREVLAEHALPSLVVTVPGKGQPARPVETDGGIEAASLPAELPRGFRVGEYEVDGVLARGGMGTVYRGEHPRIGKKVAIKVVHAELAREPEISRRFLVEARAANRIAHPNLVDVFAFGELADGRPYLVMELIEGIDLRRLLQAQGSPLERDVLEMFCQLCDALGAVHDAGLLHRDVKPENILYSRTADGTPRIHLLDLGVVKAYGPGHAEEHATRAGLAVGTPRYMAPEQLREQPLGPPTDLYALGLVLYEVLTERWPWPAARSDLAHMMAHTQEAPEIDAAFEARSPGLARLVRDLLEKEPSQRPASAALVRRRLEALAEAADHRAPDLAPTPPEPGEALATTAPAPAVATGATVPAPTPGRAHAQMVVVQVVLAVILCAAVLALALR